MSGNTTQPPFTPVSGQDPALAKLTLDEATRPRLLPIEGARPEHRAHGRHLAMIHRMYLDDLDTVGQLLESVERGEASALDLAQTVEGLDLTQNYRQFGTLCGRECYVLTMHHNIEEAQVFPILEAAGNDGLRAVVQRLQEEHKVVHALLEKLGQAAANLVEQPGSDTFSDAKEVFRVLLKVVRSHFSYEETELEEALGVYNAL
ncbi:hemerythrin domain-containing protein [Roseibium sp.]|uniref:hemerythrin domain-containing protein n=1 Tax=Roseibium sp. TaxID=1936156 RepID=UPI003A97DECF